LHVRTVDEGTTSPKGLPRKDDTVKYTASAGFHGHSFASVAFAGLL